MEGMNSFPFVNDGSFLERFKQLQEQKDAAKAEVSPSTAPSPDAVKSSLTTKKASLLPSGLKAASQKSAVSGGKLAFSLKSKSKSIVNPLKLGDDDDEDDDGQQPPADLNPKSHKSVSPRTHAKDTSIISTSLSFLFSYVINKK